jgi:2-polyprenyl-3-methyl-5-hydroxy-6-metoxy-1,4-benzoquinol methylase
MKNRLEALPHIFNCPNLSKIVMAQLNEWPEHEAFLKLRFSDPADSAIALSEQMAEVVLRLVDEDLPAYCRDYRWMSEAFIEEDLFFRRKGRYRRTTFEEAYRDIYSNAEYMERYIRGILLSQLLWKNQAQSFEFYVSRFLGQLNDGSRYLEIGPGHGLLIYFASLCERVASITGWDVSKSSIAATKAALATFGVRKPVVLEERNIMTALDTSQRFDAVAISEVMEHLDRPDRALEHIHSVMAPEGLLFLNVPCNSPAPDHIFHWDTPESVMDLVRSKGYVIADHAFVPTTGYTEEFARKRKVTLNALIIAKKPA